MGLPLWTFPQDTEAAVVEPQPEREQARARSTIRRQRSVRGRDHRIVAEERSRRIREAISASDPQALLRSERLQTLDQSLADSLSRRRSAREPIREATNSRTTGLTRTASEQRRGDITFSNPGDAWLYVEEPLRAPLRSPTPPTRSDVGNAENSSSAQVRSTSLRDWERRYAAEAFQGTTEERQERLNNLYIARARLRRLEAGNGHGDSILPPILSSRLPTPALPSFSQAFAPAQTYRVTAGERSRSRQSPPSSEVVASGNDDRVLLSEMQPLRRIGRRSISDVLGRPDHSAERGHMRRRRRQLMDGLGDRDRSISPDRDSAWDTLLTTLTPDPQPPSASSSFATGSAGNSSSSANVSAATSMTSVDNEAANTNACEYDIDDLYDTELDDETSEETGEAFRPRRFWTSYSNAAAARADRYPVNDAPTGLSGMQRIVRRLASRQDIPDEWWAEAGLSRNYSSTEAEAPI